MPHIQCMGEDEAAQLAESLGKLGDFADCDAVANWINAGEMNARATGKINRKKAKRTG